MSAPPTAAQPWPFEIPDRSASERPIDVLCLGHALVDKLAFASIGEIEAASLVLGGMTLVDGARASEIGETVSDWRRVAGGSAANTAAGVASLGGHPAFACAVGDDEAGKWYAEDLDAGGVRCVSSTVSSGAPTGVCHVFVTPDGDRSMATSLGAAGELAVGTIERAGIERAQVIYLEGYLLDAPAAQPALTLALELARQAGVLVALTLSDPFVVDRHHDRISELVFGGSVGLLLGNEEEALSLTGAGSFAEALDKLRDASRACVITRGALGAVAVLPGGDVAVSASPVASVEDTTGAGDLFAAGFLFALTQGASPEQALSVASFAAGEVIGHLGARPAVRLSDAAPAGLLDF